MISPLFLAHGSPMLAIENTMYTRFLRSTGARMAPQAIVIFTAHWEAETLTVSSHDHVYETIYDFYGFPDELYEVKYPAKGSSKLAEEIREMFHKADIPTIADSERGLDHGSWTLLHHMFPEANVPVVQISVHPYLAPEQQFQIGRAVQELAERDILVIGSGVTVHNLRAVKWDETKRDAWAVEFDDWLLDQLNRQDLNALLNYRTEAPHAELAVPRPEHFVPFYIALGSGSLEGAKPIYRSYELGNLSYLCLEF
ncbi:dioxygenase [Paenibacillus sp. CAA11]|uniref:DODA-type extradiol aromatic ring-opening family dioxygenase n=1 Tax=Paenibacillus sp. CAA11 TaxID=1532905 RepID=UPI000D3DC6BD|nr:class III extradiol ring-cleavage dioxygenase [Paenibacillus sp. CAA11]AWB44438.1 dioxygenase [Paenibacillus sp. CAA11]